MEKFIKVIKVLIDTLMTTIIIIGCIFILLFIVGIEPFVVESGSMEPAIETYSLVFINKHSSYDEVKKNDVIAFYLATGSKVVHRVINITNIGFETKGDANASSDGVSTNRDNFIGKSIFSIPKAGYVIKSMQTKRGKIIVGTIIVVLILAGILIGKPGNKKRENQGCKEEK